MLILKVFGGIFIVIYKGVAMNANLLTPTHNCSFIDTFTKNGLQPLAELVPAGWNFCLTDLGAPGHILREHGVGGDWSGYAHKWCFLQLCLDEGSHIINLGPVLVDVLLNHLGQRSDTMVLIGWNTYSHYIVEKLHPLLLTHPFELNICPSVLGVFRVKYIITHKHEWEMNGADPIQQAIINICEYREVVGLDYAFETTINIYYIIRV